MRCIAHRGFAGVNPENTVPAVRRAVEAGADAIEVDVRRCRSGELVVVHDATVDRVTDGSGAVADLPLSELASLDVLGTGRGVPTLQAVVDAVPAGVGLNVELKETGLAGDLLSVVGDRDDVLVSSFDTQALREVADRSECPLALLCAERAGAIETAESLDCAAVHPHHGFCDDPFVAAAHDAGLTVNAWTVRDTATAARLRESGVDGLIADAPSYCRV